MRNIFLRLVMGMVALGFVSLGLVGCQGGSKMGSGDTVSSGDTVGLGEGSGLDSVLGRDGYSDGGNVDSLKVVRANYDRIQGIRDWDRIDSAEIFESTEGGMVYYYFKNKVLEKLDVSYYGESGYTLAKYYLLDDKVSFVFEERYNYNSHMYAPEFDMDKTKKFGEDRFYYFDGKFFKFIGTKEQEEDVAGTRDRAQVNLDMFQKFMKIKANNYKAERD